MEALGEKSVYPANESVVLVNVPTVFCPITSERDMSRSRARKLLLVSGDKLIIIANVICAKIKKASRKGCF